MQSLVLPRPTLLLTTPFGRPSESEDGLAKLRTKFSPGRPEQQGYPSPPMSEPRSPSRRIAQTSEPGQTSYSAATNNHQRLDSGLSLSPPSSGLYSHQTQLSGQSSRPLYHGEQHSKGQSSHYQPGHSAEQAQYGAVSVQQSYGYGYPPAGISPYGGVHHGSSLVQQAAPPPVRSTKPARRTKAHVASACVNCKKAHLSCDVQRPCGRCVASGKQDTCKDVQHKKRGRPRLRDDREFSRPEEARPQSSQLLGAVPSSVPESYAHHHPFPATHQHRASDPPRPVARLLEGHLATARPIPVSGANGQHSSFGTIPASTYAGRRDLGYQALPVAFLNLDLVIQRSNQAFQDLVSFLGDVRGRHLGELLEARQDESLVRLRNELRDERDERDPTYMAPIIPGGQDPMRSVMESLVDRDVDQVSHGYTDRTIFLSFRLPSNSQYQSLQVQVRLAKTSLYFVTLVVLSAPRLSAPPLLTQQLAPPTPARSSQTMSAPTTAPVRDFTPHQVRPLSSTSSAPSSPYFNFSSVRTSLPAFSPSSYGSSPSYSYSPTSGPESSYFPTLQPPSTGSAFPSPYAASSRNPLVTSDRSREAGRPQRLERLHLPPIRTGPARLGSPLQMEGTGATDRDRVRRRITSPQNDDRRPETPETGKRRRLDIHEVLE